MSENLSLVLEFLKLVGEAEENRVVSEHNIDFTKLKKLLSDDFVIVNPLFHPAHGIVKGVTDTSDGSLHGPDGMEKDIKATASHFKFSVKDFTHYDAGDVILFRGTISILGARSGKSVETKFAELFFVEDGLIRRIEPYLNVNALREVL